MPEKNNTDTVPAVNTNTVPHDSTDSQNDKAEPEKENTVPTVNTNTVPHENTDSQKDTAEPEKDNPTPAANTDAVVADGEYNEGTVLVKVKDSFDKKDLGTLAYTSVEPLYKGSRWYDVKLTDAEKTDEAVTYLSNLGSFEKVDYDYIMGTEAEAETVEVTGNPDYEKQSAAMDTHFVTEAWDYLKSLGKRPGGSSDVVVAVIDTGVDYNHLDLRDNIWTNPAEIPDNGIDDDGNGYVDDVRGWNCVADNNDPMDDNGHGTHVAGIIAAENNLIGGVGVAYNCKVMVLKAGNSSGYFNNSDIAEAIQYAYMNGASVINMSFGGSMVSLAAEEALENAYNQCILVAAAGNDGRCNQPGCCRNSMPSYPAALPYVIGVMSTDPTGLAKSGFSNFDHNPYNSIEYEVYAVGGSVFSTWPNNKYAVLNGTSMATPQVAGIAALLRSYYSDRKVYSTKYIQSQIVNTGTVNPVIDLALGIDKFHSVANVYEALTKLPKPAVKLYDYSIDDSTVISSANNGNGVVDAGETVRLHFVLYNRGGVASNVNVSIDTMRNNDPSLTDPYFTFNNTEMTLSDIGTYSVRDSGDTYFEIVVSPDCPNDYLVNFNIRYTYTNGMDEKDTAVYTDDGRQIAQFNVSRGYHLPRVIKEDTVYAADRLYIVGENVLIPAGVTVTFEEGCEIQFYDDREYYNSPAITVYGTLNITGSRDHMVKITPNERNAIFICPIGIEVGGAAFIDYADCVNLCVTDKNYDYHYYDNMSNSSISNSYLKSETDSVKYVEGQMFAASVDVSVGSIINSYINIRWGYMAAGEIVSNYIVMDGYGTDIRPYLRRADDNSNVGKFTNNIIYTALNVKDARLTDRRVLDLTLCNEVSNNVFLCSDNTNPKTFLKITFNHGVTFANNKFAEYFYTYADQLIEGYLDANGNPTVDVYGSCSDISKLWPHIVNIEFFNKDGEQVTTIGKEEIKVRVEFSKDMDTTVNPGVFFGSIELFYSSRKEKTPKTL